jgi:lysyl-tRNA synthetase class I
MSNVLAAYFFNIEYYDDPNVEITREEINRRHSEAATMIVALEDLINSLETINATDATEIQAVFYDVGKRNFGEGKEELRRFFSLLYMVLWHSTAGPRFGIFANLYGISDFISMIRARRDEALNWI